MARVPAPRTVRVTRYVTPLREGGSLPAIVEADDDGMYVLKFRGAGQGPRALVAELVSGEIARALGLPVPELVFAELDADLARTEPDPEIADLIRASGGLNLALDYPAGIGDLRSRGRAARRRTLASRIVWFDALRHQRRSHGPQHEPADVAPPPLADRPRRLALLPPRARLGGEPGRARAIRSPLRQAARAAAAGAARSSRSTRSWPGGSTPDVIEAIVALGPGCVADRRHARLDGRRRRARPTRATCATGWKHRGRSWRRRSVPR